MAYDLVTSWLLGSLRPTNSTSKPKDCATMQLRFTRLSVARSFVTLKIIRFIVRRKFRNNFIAIFSFIIFLKKKPKSFAIKKTFVHLQSKI